MHSCGLATRLNGARQGDVGCLLRHGLGGRLADERNRSEARVAVVAAKRDNGQYDAHDCDGECRQCDAALLRRAARASSGVPVRASLAELGPEGTAGFGSVLAGLVSVCGLPPTIGLACVGAGLTSVCAWPAAVWLACVRAGMAPVCAGLGANSAGPASVSGARVPAAPVRGGVRRPRLRRAARRRLLVELTATVPHQPGRAAGGVVAQLVNPERILVPALQFAIGHRSSIAPFARTRYQIRRCMPGLNSGASRWRRAA